MTLPSYLHRYQYARARKTNSAATIQSQGFHGVSIETIRSLEADYQRTAPYARCGWCDIETGILKIDAHVCGVACSENCEMELREHYT